MKLFPKAHDVLDAIGAWEDSYTASLKPAERKEAKDYAATTLETYVWWQVFLFTVGALVLEHILRWLF